MDLHQLRQQIDSIDNELIELLVKRIGIVKKVGSLKQQDKSAIYRPEREKAIVERLSSMDTGLLNKQAIEAIFQEIFAISRHFELPERVAYLGPMGSFTHQAAESRFGPMSHYLELKNIRSVFESVSTERSKYGVVPVENNQEGVVEETVDLLGDFELQIVAEVPLDIHFSFASTEDDLSKIKRIYSKDIAFRQCRSFIANHFPTEEIELVPVDSTSKAVKIAEGDPKAAAICSNIAAKLYALPILFSNIEDSVDNITRFLILSKNVKNQPGKEDKTSLLVNISHEPGALAQFLQDFHNAGINLTKIESRPAKKGKNFSYRFFIDFDGHIDEKHIQPIFNKHRNMIKWLGSYPKMC